MGVYAGWKFDFGALLLAANCPAPFKHASHTLPMKGQT